MTQTAASSVEAAADRPQATSRTIFACVIGNVLEWYDFTAYGFLAVVIGQSFFPTGDSFATIMAAFGALAAGYGARPLGSIIGGHLGDKYGRKPTMLLAMSVMGVATFLIGLLPTYDQIGVTAAVLLVAIRIVQGLAVAGEYSSSAVLLVETAPAARRGFVGSWIAFACLAGCLLGSGVAALSAALVGEAAMHAWGWRVPFLVGGVIAVIGIMVRRHLTESLHLPEEERAKFPLGESLRHHWREKLTIIAINMPIAVSYFVIFVYAVSYLTDRMHFTTGQAMDIDTLSLVAIVILIPLAGLVSDRIGRKPVLYACQIGTILIAWPAWYLMHEPDLGLILVGQLMLAALSALGWAMTIPIMIEILPAKVRCTAAGLGYNLSMALFGGTTPLVAAYLVERTGDDFTPIYYVIAASAIACLAIWRLPEMAGKPLPED
jgi:MHS family proline/betaine transporter-like MFS transporter